MHFSIKPRQKFHFLTGYSFIADKLRACFLLGLLTYLLLCSHHALAGKKRCKPYLEKLHKIQAQQKQAHNLKKANKLKAREEKAREKWWLCENNRLPQASTKKTKTNKKQTKIAKVKNSKKTEIKPSRRVKEQKVLKAQAVKAANGSQENKAANQDVATQPNKLLTYVNAQPVDDANKQQAWADFYQTPKLCRNPKTISAFSYCAEHKKQQRKRFEKSYQN